MRHAFSTTRSSGFSLIEILVTVAIMLTLTGGGIAGYLNLRSRQNLVNAGKEVEQILRSAQKKARVGDKPSGCNGALVGYRVSLISDPVRMILEARCVTDSRTVQTYAIPSGVTVTTFSTMNFAVLHGGVVTGAGTVLLNSASPSYSYQFSVDPGGNISEPVITRN